jgi:DNA invertase Pin-like site-specific DNA recombinase
MTGGRDRAVANHRALLGAFDARAADAKLVASIPGGRKTERRRGDQAGAAPGGRGHQVAATGGPRRRVIGYITVHNGAPRASDDAATAIQRACELSDWRLVEIVSDRDSGRRSLERPGMGYALGRITAGEAQGLVVSELIRLVRSQVDLGSFLQWFRERDAPLIALDLDIDTSTAEGQRIAEVLITLGECEQDRIAQRTKSGLADAKAAGRPVGRP